MTMTMTEATLTCPSWCRTDHQAEHRGWERMQEETVRYMRAAENQPEMRHAFGADFVPPPGGSRLEPDEPEHEQEVGRVYVRGRDFMVPARVVIHQVGADEPALVTVLVDRAYYEDAYTAQQSRALAALLVLAARVLEA